MTPENQNPEQRNRMAGVNIFYISALVVLLGASIYLFAANRTKENQRDVLTTQLNESNTRYADLDKQYEATLAEVASYKGQNATLDSIIDVKENQLKTFQAALAKAKKDRMISDADYKKQMEQLGSIVSDLTAQVEALQKDKTVLITRNDSLGRRVAEETVLTQNLSATNKVLTTKVTIASLLVPQNINAEALKERSNGKETTTSRASKATELRVCFDVGENKVADAGQKTFFARILGPDGVTIAVEDKGSGVFQMADTSNGEKAFTTKQTIDYDQKPQNVCMFWKQTTAFSPGHYTAEIYQDGYFIGKSDFVLK